MNRKSHDDDHVNESWLIPYADLLTLLLALFIVLFATSSADQELLDAMKAAFYEEYNGIMEGAEEASIFDGTESVIGEVGLSEAELAELAADEGAEEGSDASGADEANGMEVYNPELLEEDIVGDSGDGDDEGINAEGESAQTVAEDPAAKLIATLQQEFSDYVELNNLESAMKLDSQEEGLVITLTSDIWFPSGSADINESQREIAAQLSEMIAKVQTESQVPLAVIVSGHTDNIPISGSSFPSNWWLSMARAVNFMEALMNTSTLNPSNFSARGFGEYEPVDTNDTEEGRRHNRRVEIMISPEVPK